MSIFRHTIFPMYTDYNCNASPAELARMIIGDTLLQIDADGIPRLRLITEKHSVWMVDKFALSQSRSIPWGSELEIDIAPRAEKGVRIYYSTELRIGGEAVGTAQLSFFAVDYDERRVMRLSELSGMWNEPAQPGKAMPRAAFRGDMQIAGSERVRWSDCDSNHHFTSPKYLDLVCDFTDFWGGEERVCSYMQVDYVSECRPGEELRILRAGDGESVFVRGEHSDGSTAFDAVCRYS